MSDEPLPDSGIILYQTEDGRTRIQCRFENETVWLSQKLMAELFQKDVRTINEHIQNVFAEGELVAASVIRKFRTTAADGKNYETQHYNLEAILAVGFRVRSHRGTQFCQWAIGRLNEYLVKGFTMDAYIEFAELRALQRKVMTMRDWVTKLDEFLKLSEHELLDHAGKISAEQAKMKAELEYESYRALLDSRPRAVDLDFEKVVSGLKKLPKPKK